MERKRELHTIEPFYARDSELLILGSFPSVKSREEGFYYAHKSNRFWKVMAEIFSTGFTDTESKKEFLLKNHIALWDTIAECTVIGSSDSSIENAEPTDIKWILSRTRIHTIVLNGNKSRDVFRKYNPDFIEAEVITLPSTSAANASYSLEELTSRWSQIRDRIT